MKLMNIQLGPVSLRVRSLVPMRRFYEDVLGMRVIEETETTVTLGTATRPLLTLHEVKTAQPNERAAGLFHVAFLLPNRLELGRLLAHLMRHQVNVGQGDHLVSEAFYLNDPEGNGIEVYADRPRTEWTYEMTGQIRMATERVDYESMLAAAASHPFDGLSDDTVVGHVHLKVRSLDAARRFYQDRLGFTVTTDTYPGALFLAADGYHHHIGANVWSRVSDVSTDETGLMAWTLHVDAATNRRLGGTASEWSLVDEDGITVYVKSTDK